VLVAIFASWMGLQIAGQAAANRAQRWIVLGTGSLALGAGVWAMHFIGMLAFDLCTDVDYDPPPPSSRACRASAPRSWR
jgi:NO-binding membrane sensor protein with MHYT domain